MKKKIRAEVTERDIRLGVCGDSRRCPIARALNRAMGTRQAVGVGSEIMFDRDGLYLTTPKVLLTFMNRFDNRKPVSPFSFTLNLPK